MDIIRDIFERIEANPKKPLAEIEREVRVIYGGDRAYIPKVAARDESARMADAIVRDFRAGESVELLVRRYKRSRRRIEQIITDHLQLAKSSP